MDATAQDALFLRTIELAEKGWGRTHPNPMVGARIVENGEVVGEGYHAVAGHAHAEVEAFRSLGRPPQAGAELYVSLEPCSTDGRTPPCTRAILDSGITRVRVATRDPNPSHAGRGLDLLREAGVDVILAEGEIRERAERLNFIFNHNMEKGSPLVALKVAESADGFVTREAGRPSEVTGPEARADMMRWRRLFPAICVGAGTALADDPSLTARLPQETWCPVRLVLDTQLSTLASDVVERRLYADEFSDHTVLLVTEAGLARSGRVVRAESLGLRLLPLEAEASGRIRPQALRSALTELGLNAVYCEGGPAVAASLLEAGEIDYFFHYQSPQTFAGPGALPGPGVDRRSLGQPIRRTLGPDQLHHGYL
ncbi:MAG: bifunctional diaminohydroxyphosphoribosylaminopyrimidine deaminase/5-amino-6-(5-phosphoribosylamino)uracil reductase RibD [Verrucomicrobiota bacterium]|nr:bifunctional diaminohydroxyphosphoribosylaminopyrimidine deaminase/5-amino-6-(5-phosphoribosylamino)uracil reductase RibD [Verrucomicrobiota bacterium]